MSNFKLLNSDIASPLKTTQALPFWKLQSAPDQAIALRVAATGEEITYAQLRQRRDDILTGLNQGPGICIIRTAPTVSCIAAYLAALNAGYPVILEDGKTADTTRGSAFPCMYSFNATDNRFAVNTQAAAIDLHPELRVLLSTSGSTGARKYVRLSGENLASNAAAVSEYLRITPSDIAPTSLPLAYSYGMSVLNSHLHAGASLLLIDEPIVSETFWQAFESKGCTSFAGVPQSFTLLAQGGQLDRRLPKLRYVTQAGGKLGPDAVRRWARTGRRQGWDFFVMYGQTEASPRIAYLPPKMALKKPGAIGQAIPGGRLWIGGEDQTELSAGQEGELIYEGPNVMMGYATDVSDLAKGQGSRQLRTGDLGFADAAGIVTITGRASRFLKLAGKRVSLDEIEARLSSDGINAIATGRDDLLGLVHTGDRSLGAEIAKWLAVPATFVRDIPVETLPLNQNAKPDLKAAKALFEARCSATQNSRAGSNAGQDPVTVTALFKRQFPGRKITPDLSFDDLGGTSNDFIELELALDEAGIQPVENWQVHSISELAARLQQVQPVRQYVPDFGSARVICTLLVVLLHVIGVNANSGLELPEDSIWHRINQIFDPLRMPLFALLSGYAFDAMGNIHSAPRDMMTTIGKRLIAPTAAALLTFAAMATVLNTRLAILNTTDAIELLLLPYAHYWFIMSLTVMMLTSYGLLRDLPGRSDMVLIALAITFTVFTVQIDPNIWGVNGAAKLMPFFAIGYFYSAHAKVVHRHWMLVLSVAIGILVMSGFTGLSSQTLPWRMENLAVSLAAIAVCLTLAGHIPLIARIAPYTFFIYLWHVIGTSGMRRTLEIVDINGTAPNIVLGLMAGVALPIIFYHILGYLPLGRYIRGK